MTKLYSRMFPVILILIFEITIATAALTNVWAAVAFYTQKGGSASQDEMYYVAVNDYTDRDIEYQEYLDSAKKSVKAFFDEMSKSDCEIWVYPVAVEAAEGDNVLCRLYLGTKEDSEYFNQVKGVYVGNDIKYYCKNNKIKIFSHLNETGAINMQLSKGGVVVEKIDIKGEKLEEYFMDRVGGEVSV